MCSEEEFSALILITGSSKAFVEMAITEDQAPEKSWEKYIFSSSFSTIHVSRLNQGVL